MTINNVASMTNTNSKIGIGTVQFGIPYGISNKHGQTPEAEVKLILNYAKEDGIDVLDTASAYGNSEKVLGKNDLSAFKITSKFLLQNDQCSISQQLKESLQNLNVNSLYGYMAHRPMEVVDNPGLWDQLIQLKEQGSIKKIGFSFNEVYEIENILTLELIPDIIQVPYNYFDNRFEPYIIELKKLGCEIHARSPFLQGLFFTDTQALSDYFSDVKPIIEKLQKLGDNLSGMLLKYCTEKPFIDKVIFGVNTLYQLKENVKGIAHAGILPLNTKRISNLILIPSKWPK